MAKLNPESVARAVAAYNADAKAAGRWPLPRGGRGECPVCGHKKCWGNLPNNADRWACFSTAHPATVGIQGKGCIHGDRLDLDIFAAGCDPTPAVRIEWLTAHRYLDAPAPRSNSKEKRKQKPRAPTPRQIVVAAHTADEKASAFPSEMAWLPAGLLRALCDEVPSE